MHRTKKMVSQLAALAVLVVLAACDEYCDQGTTSAMVVALRTEETSDEQIVTQNVLKLVTDEFSVKGEGEVADSLRLTFYSSQGLWLLPLSNTSDTTCFLIQVKDSPRYRLQVTATRSAQLVSEACGCATVASIRTVEVEKVADTQEEASTWTIKHYEISDPQVRVLTFTENYRYVPNVTICF